MLPIMRWPRMAGVLVVVAACGRMNFDPVGGESGGTDARDGDAGSGDAGSRRIVNAALGNAHVCVQSSTGRIKCWGVNSWGVLGIGDADPAGRGDDPGEVAALPSVSLGSSADVTILVSQADFTCALVNGRVKCWGNNDGFQLGTGDSNHRGDAPGEMGDSLTAVGLSSGGDITAIAVGHYHTCVVRDGGVACWGIDDQGQNGYAGGRTSANDLATLTPVNLGTFVAAQLDAGFNHTCAVDTQGRVKCWGMNIRGMLGLGDTATRGDQLAEMGNALPFVNLGTGVTVSSFAVGYFHACAITNVGVKCWGEGASGSIGYGNTNNRGDGPNEMGDALPVVDVGGQVTQLAAGEALTCALLAGGDVKCWGESSRGELGIGDTNDRGDQVGEMGTALPRVPLPEPAQRVFVGGNHACAILASGGFACWGRNVAGSLGAGHAQDVGDQPGEAVVIHTVSSLWP
jgi:alpha-tubulin suppressor-like RCC1 family protein